MKRKTRRPAGCRSRDLRGQGDLVRRGVRIGDPQRLGPVALVEQPRQRVAQGGVLVEEAHPADAGRVVAPAAQAVDDGGAVEHAGGLGGGLAPLEAQRQQARVLARQGGRGQKAGEEGLVRRVGEAARAVTPLPPAGREQRRQVGGLPGVQLLHGHVVAQGVQHQQQQVVAPHDRVHVEVIRHVLVRAHPGGALLAHRDAAVLSW